MAMSRWSRARRKGRWTTREDRHPNFTNGYLRPARRLTTHSAEPASSDARRHGIRIEPLLKSNGSLQGPLCGGQLSDRLCRSGRARPLRRQDETLPLSAAISPVPPSHRRRLLDKSLRRNPGFAPGCNASVFFNVAQDSPAWRKEIFGPVLSVQIYDELEAAIASANDTEYGLSACVFGNNAKSIQRAANELEADMVAVNSFCDGDLTTPFGGFKTCGFGGKDKESHALDQDSCVKTI
jgi:hypothetical protein